MEDIGWWGVLIAIVGGAIRVSTPFLFVSLGETITERSGRINLGLEGTLVFGAMVGYTVAHVLAARFAAAAILGDPTLAPAGMGSHDTVAGIIADRAFAAVDLRVYVSAAWIGVAAAGVIAAIFAVHPVHVESVAWITERKNVLSGSFYLAAGLCYLHAAGLPALTRERAGIACDWRWYAASLLLFVCALLSKTVTATLPVVLLLVTLLGATLSYPL